MKNFVIVCVLLSLMISCKATKQLPAADDQMLNISGQWNSTDAAIAAAQFEKSFKNNSWYKALLAKDSVLIHIFISEVDYSETLDSSNRTLDKEIGDKLKSIPHIKLFDEKPEHVQYFTLSTSLQANQIDSFGENAVQYNIFFRLTDAQENILMKDKQSIKKYINQ